MAPPADGTTLPDAGTKLRMVLDYVPCEACLAHPVDDQDLLCSLCARLDRQVAVRVRTRTTVLIERPSLSSAPVVIAPASMPEPEATVPAEAVPAPPTPAPARPIVVRFADDALAPPGSIDVVVEPLTPLPLPMLAPLPVAAATVAPIADVAPEPEEPELEFDDIVSFVPARDEFFDYRKRPAGAAAAASARVVREKEPEPPAVPIEEPLPPPEDDFVFRPPSRDEPRAPDPPAVRDDVVPAEEVPVEPAREVVAEPQHEWAPPPDFLAEEEPAPLQPTYEPAPEPVYEAELVEEPAPPMQEERPIGPAMVEDLVHQAEEEILELEQVEDEEDVVEMEIVEEPLDVPEPAPRAREPEPTPWAPPAPPAPAPAPLAAPTPAPPAQVGDLYRVRGLDAASVGALNAAGLTEVSHLSGRDAADIAGRTGLPLARLQAWIHVADLVVEVGVPIDAANALVAAGIAGPKGLADADADEVADRVAAFGGATVAARDIKRWKRRA